MRDRLKTVGYRSLLAIALLLGALVGITCGDDDAGASDTNGAIAAADVSYDAALSALVAGNVQAALDELDSRLDGAEAAGSSASGQLTTQGGRLDALEATAPGEGVVDGLGSQVKDLSGKVTALEEAAPPAAGETTVEAVAGLEASTVQEAIAELVSRQNAQDATITAQAAEIADLTQQLEAAHACPEGMQRITDFCIDSAPRAKAVWFIAASECSLVGHVCSYSQLRNACERSGSSQSESEWTSTWVDVDTLVTAQLESGSCHHGQSVKTVPAGDIDERPYHCCTSR